MNVAPGATYEAVIQAPTGLVGTLTLGLLDNEGAYADPAVADDILEFPAGSGIYAAARVAPPLAGQYTLLWSLDGTTDPAQLTIEPLVVTASRPASAAPSGRDLCDLGDVLRYVPGYVSEPDIDDTLQVLISAESRELLKAREFTPIPGLTVRRFPLDGRTVEIGDCVEVDALEVFDELGTSRGTIDVDEAILLPLVREEWEPVTSIKLPRHHHCRGYLQVTATWGFPFVPEDVRQACAKRVILRYLNDVAAAGTAFADALNDATINIAGLFRSAEETVDFYRRVGVA